MAGKVEIFGGQLDGSVLSNAATESTLRELVNAINGVTGGGGTGAGGGGGGGGSGAAGGVTGGFKGISKVASTLASSLGSMTKLVVSGNQSLSTFVGSLKTGIAGIDKMTNAAVGFVKYFEEAQGTLRDLSKNGAAFNNSVLDLKEAASTAEMELTQFQKAIQMNSKGLLGYGQTLTQSAQRAARIVKAGSDSGVTLALMNLGMSSEESREYIMEFSASLAKSNRLRATSDTTLALTSLSYFKELDALAKITGKSREQQEEALKELTAETLYRQKMARLGPDQQAEIQATMAKIQAKQGMEAARIYRDQLIGVSVPLRKAARMQTALFNDSTEANRRLADAQLRGVVGQERINDVVNTGTAANAKAAKGLEHLAAVGVAGGEAATAVSEAYRGVVTPIDNMGQNIDEVSKASLDAQDAAAKEEQNRIGVMDKTLNQFQDSVKRVQFALERLKNTLMRVTTDALEPLITWAIDFFTKASHFATQGLDRLADWIDRSSHQFGTYVDKWWFAIKEFFGPKLLTKAGLVLENGFLTLMANTMEAVGGLLDKVGLGGPMLKAARNMREAIEENNKAFNEAKESEKDKIDKDKEALAAQLRVREAEYRAIIAAQNQRRAAQREATTARVAPAQAQAGIIAQLSKQGITDPRAVANILAMVQGESGFQLRSELSLAGTSNQRIRETVFKGNKGIAGLSDAQIDQMKKGDSSGLYNIAYDDANRGARNKLGNTQPGDGFKYRGRGFHGLTGKSNYAAASQAIFGDDRLVRNPDLANDPNVAGMAAAWYYAKKGQSTNLNDITQVFTATYGANNQPAELAKRSGYAEQFLQQLGPQRPGNTNQGPGPSAPAPQSSSNQESAVNPVANLNSSLDNMVSLMREQVTQQKNLVTVIKRLNGNVQTAVT
jgi:predicted chitinase